MSERNVDFEKEVKSRRPRSNTGKTIMRLTFQRRRSSALTKAKKTQKRIVLVGSTKSGKTALVKRFVNNEFSTVYQPTVEDVYYHNYKYGARHFQLEMVDMPSPFMFPVMRDLHIKEADVVMLIYDINNRSSFTELMNAWKQITDIRPNLPVIIVGTKEDLMTFPQNAEEQTANLIFEMTDTCDIDVEHILTSAKNDVGVKRAFEICLDQISNENFSGSNSSVSSSDEVLPSCFYCCF